MLNNFKIFLLCVCSVLLCNHSKIAIDTHDIEVPAEVARKFKRDAARLALRLQMQSEQLQHIPIQIQGNNTEKIYKSLCQIYTQTDQGQAMERCNIHTFPDPSIDHLVIIYKKTADWAAPLQKGLTQTNSIAFNELVNRHQLILEKHFLWTDACNAITLRSKEAINIAALAQEFAQIEGVVEYDLGIPKLKGNDITVRRNSNSWDFEYILRFGSWANGSGESHKWLFQVSDAGTVKYLGELGASIPGYLKCR